MLTFQSIAKVTRDHALAVHLPTTLDEGEYPVLVVLEETKRAPRRRLTFASHRLGTSAGETFSRGQIYGDDGR
jgi:hypothetical protein